jgi:hypothetical protein
MEVVKIKKVDAENLKAVGHFTAFFDGKSAHITGANGKGKSTVIRALTDRLRGLKPNVITKIGETEGKTVLELTDGCKFVWEYNNQGQDKLSYFAANTYKPARRDIFQSMCAQYFPNQFDINKFLTTTEPRKRLQMISELINVDLSEVQGRYKGVAETRRDAKKALRLMEDQIMVEPDSKAFESIDEYCKKENALISEIVEDIDAKKEDIKDEKDRLNAAYVINKNNNEEKEKAHKEAYRKELDKWLLIDVNRKRLVQDFNNDQIIKAAIISDRQSEYNDIKKSISETFKDLFDWEEANNILCRLPKPEIEIIYNSTERPELKKLELPDPMPSAKKLNELEAKLVELEDELKTASEALKVKESELSEIKAAKQVYDLQVAQYTEHKTKIKALHDSVQICEANVLEVLNEIKAIIKKSELPDDFLIDLTEKNDILFRVTPDSEYLPITNETLASSAIFIAAFKLQANYLTAFKVAHFDISYLDYENRKKVLQEAINMGIQLLTESPAMSESEMSLQYTITED